MDIYAQNILDRYKSPYHKGTFSDSPLHHEEANHSCGDKCEVFVKLDGDKIAGYGFEGVGCAISMASADILGDLIDGLTIDEVLALTKEDIYEALGIEISLRRSKCALLGFLALQNLLLGYNKQPPRTWSDYHL